MTHVSFDIYTSDHTDGFQHFSQISHMFYGFKDKNYFITLSKMMTLKDQY